MNKTILLFDADGVVINSEMFSVQYQKDFKLSPDKMLPFFKGIFQDCLIGKADLKIVIKPYLKKWLWSGSVDDFLSYWFKAEHKIDERIVDLVKNLRKNSIACYLATNQEKYRTEYMRKEMKFDKIFDGIFSSAEIGAKKPQAEFYESIIKKLKVDKEKILYIDHSPAQVAGAKAAGIDAYLYTNFDQLNNDINSLLN